MKNLITIQNNAATPMLSNKRGLMLFLDNPEIREAPHTWSDQTLKLVRENANLIDALSADIRLANIPATRTEIGFHINALRNHFFRDVKSEHDNQTWVDDWLASCSEIPADLLALACKRWRESTERGFPSPGRLLETVEYELSQRRILDWRSKCARKFLNSDEGTIPKERISAEQMKALSNDLKTFDSGKLYKHRVEARQNVRAADSQQKLDKAKRDLERHLAGKSLDDAALAAEKQDMINKLTGAE